MADCGTLCSAFGRHLRHPGNPVSLIIFCTSLGVVDSDSCIKAAQTAVWNCYYNILSMVVSIIVLTLWVGSLHTVGYSSASLFVDATWPVIFGMFWAFLVVVLSETRHETGLLIYAVLQVIWTGFGIYNCFNTLINISYMKQLGGSTHLWYIIFVLQVPTIFFGFALAFWCYHAHKVVKAGGAPGTDQLLAHDTI